MAMTNIICVAVFFFIMAIRPAPAHATEDFCITVTKTPDGFLALREGPATQFKMIAKLKPGFPLDADTGGGFGKWTRVWIAARRSA
jgi:hypothetical protein